MNSGTNVENVIRRVLALIMQVPDLDDVRIIVGGDLALWKHLSSRVNTNIKRSEPEDMPSSALKIRDIPNGAIPYICPTGLLVLKAEAAGARDSFAGKRTHATDAVEIMETQIIRLSDAQRERVKFDVRDLARYGNKPQTWWNHRLGI